MEDNCMITEGFSKAIYSTWLFCKPLRMMFDAGEGIAPFMRNRVYAVERLWISHGHYDHVGGIPGLVRIRQQGRGDKEKPLLIYHPSDDAGCAAIRRFVNQMMRETTFDVEWRMVSPGDKVELEDRKPGMFMEVFPMEHTPGRPAVGYNVVESRRRLRRELRNLDQEIITLLAREKGRDAITEEYHHRVFSYTGDGLAVAPEYVRGTDCLVHEATFLSAEDRGREVHAAVEEVVDVAVSAEVSSLILFHVSGRYPAEVVYRRVEEVISERRVAFPVGVMLGSRLTWLGQGGNGDGAR